MERKNANEKIKGKPQKETRKTDWRSHIFGVLILLSVFCLMYFFQLWGPLPRDTERLQGTIVILDENGDVLPYRDTVFTFYSRYARGFFRSELRRKRNLYVDDAEFGNSFPVRIPRHPATLFFHTRNGRYAAVVDLAQGEPTTGLVVTLRPRHSAMGRLVDYAGVPLANVEFTLDFLRLSSGPSLLLFPGSGVLSAETFESKYGETDADGYFTVDRLIPGLEYRLRIHVPRNARGHARVTMPILEPEQYQEPFDLGDVLIRFFGTVPPSARCC